MAAIRKRDTAPNSRTQREAEDAFISAAETPSSESLSAEQRLEKRADSRYYGIINYRGTEEQKALIDFAAKKAGLSRQKLLEGILMPELEKQYGIQFDNDIK